MKNIVNKKDRIFEDYTEAVYCKFKQIRFGISSCSKVKDLNYLRELKELVDWQSKTNDFNTLDQNIKVSSDGCQIVVITNPENNPLNVAFEFIQDPAAAIWIIPHGLKFVPNVWCEDTEGNEIEGVVEAIDKNNLKITFSEPVAGKAYLS